MADPDDITEIGRLPLVDEVARIRRRRRTRNITPRPGRKRACKLRGPMRRLGPLQSVRSARE